ncbi:hypothetical protein OLMES_4198 [Oleiphilus messinensis]|uniref:Uncharacterized protein n=1 Tax=Oleiphilus messinensis TaxID=141451 RepID=A0A1Y0IFR1_9GAMM|nr:hypothetical protein [Oleiphilus messinensis]ARU58214.1 hypothetical protein OLMES_4198 [Oleiphilus messinensis]
MGTLTSRSPLQLSKTQAEADKKAKVYGVMMPLLFAAGVIMGVFGYATIQEENEEYYKMVAKDLSVQKNIYQQKFTLSKDILSVYVAPGIEAYKTQLTDSLNRLYAQSELSIVEANTDKTILALQGDTFTVPFNWQPEQSL